MTWTLNGYVSASSTEIISSIKHLCYARFSTNIFDIEIPYDLKFLLEFFYLWKDKVCIFALLESMVKLEHWDHLNYRLSAIFKQ